VDAAAVEVVNAVSSEKMPISLNPHQKSSEQTTMKYRHLQLRTPEMQHTLRSVGEKHFLHPPKYWVGRMKP
jgi:aspartyl-tRNA synthetase